MFTFAICIAFFGCVKYAALYHVTDSVAEVSDTGSISGIEIVSHFNIFGGNRTHVPALTVDNDSGVNFVKSCTNSVHCIDIKNAHEVETEAVEVIFVSPVSNRVNDKFAYHRTF